MLWIFNEKYNICPYSPSLGIGLVFNVLQCIYLNVYVEKWVKIVTWFFEVTDHQPTKYVPATMRWNESHVLNIQWKVQYSFIFTIPRVRSIILFVVIHLDAFNWLRSKSKSLLDISACLLLPSFWGMKNWADSKQVTSLPYYSRNNWN